MEHKNDFARRIVSSIVLGGFLAILLYAPSVRADEEVPSGETMDIDYDVGGALNIFGTANLYSGAYAKYYIYAYPGAKSGERGSKVNIYGCAPGNTLLVLGPGTHTYTGEPPEVTIYGSSFRLVETGESFSPPHDQVIIDGTLNVLDKSGEVLFSLTIWSWNDVPVYLRASEKECLKAELCVMPKVINRHRSRLVVFATTKLPKDIKKDDVDRDYRLKLYANDNEVGIEAKYQRIFQSCRQKSSRVKIFAFFNLGSLLDGLPDNCEELQIQVCGRLNSGQEFYGNDTIKIMNPPKKHWSRRSSKYRHR